jgi:hypothetical protein
VAVFEPFVVKELALSQAPVEATEFVPAGNPRKKCKKE